MNSESCIDVLINPCVIFFSGAGSRMFTTDRIETAYGQVRWNAVFTCQDLTAEEAAGSHLCLSLWEDSFQRGEIKLGKTGFYFYIESLNIRH